MKSKLLITVAAVALIGGTTFAIAQQEEHGGAAKPGATEQHAPGGAPGGAMQHTQAPGGAAQAKPESKGMNEQHSVQGSPTEERGNAPMQRGAQDEKGKAGVNAQEHAQTQPSGKSDENAQSQDRAKTQDNAQSQDRSKTQENAQSQDRNGQNQTTAQSKSNSGGKSVQLSDTQRTQIKSVIVQNRDVARVNNVNFNITVGTAVPRDVHVAVLPAEVVTIVPEYRGFDYIVVGDQLLIIDPNSLEIVAILPV
jgi:hypothetical protein